MGQYYRFGIFKPNVQEKKDIRTTDDVATTASPYTYNDGAKIMEQAYVGNSYVKRAEEYLAGKFYKYRFVWVGDYADKIKIDDNSALSVYKILAEYNEKYGDVKDEHTDIIDKMQRKYILNFSKKEAIEIKKNIEDINIHPLPLLCADGNGRGGGGDYYGTYQEYVGSWAYDIIGISDFLNLAEGWKLLVITFKEQY